MRNSLEHANACEAAILRLEAARHARSHARFRCSQSSTGWKAVRAAHPELEAPQVAVDSFRHLAAHQHTRGQPLLLSRRCCGCSSICACPAGRLQLLDESAGSAPVDDAPARSHPLHAARPDDALRAHANARSTPGASACSCSQARSHFSTAPACATRLPRPVPHLCKQTARSCSMPVRAGEQAPPAAGAGGAPGSRTSPGAPSCPPG